MSTTRGKSGKKVQKNGPVLAARVSDASDAGAVLTLSEAAAYLASPRAKYSGWRKCGYCQDVKLAANGDF